MINFYDYNSIEKKEAILKRNLWIVLLLDVILLSSIILLFFLLNRSNAIYMSIIIGLLMLILLAGTYFYFFTIHIINKHDIKFVKHLSQYEGKTNYIFGFEIKNEMINKFNKTFYVVNYQTKNKLKEGYLDVDKLDLISNVKIERLEVKDRVITAYKGVENE